MMQETRKKKMLGSKTVTNRRKRAGKKNKITIEKIHHI